MLLEEFIITVYCKVRARKRWYLTNRIARKVLAHTIGVFINKKYGNPPLQFELLIKP